MLLIVLPTTTPGGDVKIKLLFNFVVTSRAFIAVVCVISKELCSGTRLTENRDILRIFRLSSGVETIGEILDALQIFDVDYNNQLNKVIHLQLIQTKQNSNYIL